MYAKIIIIQRAFRKFIKLKNDTSKPIKQIEIYKNSRSMRMSLRKSVSSNVSMMRSLSVEMCDESKK
jgi:hypothetical protein